MLLDDINKIKDNIKADNYEMSQHALERALECDIWKDDIEHAKWIEYKRRK